MADFSREYIKDSQQYYDQQSKFTKLLWRLTRNRGAFHQSQWISQKKFRDWVAQTVTKVSRQNYKNQLNLVPANGISAGYIGAMLVFFYNAKTKKKLPYWDRFPLVLMVGPAEGGFYGLNLHYIPPQHRAVLFDLMHGRTPPRQFEKDNPDIDEDIMKGTNVPGLGTTKGIGMQIRDPRLMGPSDRRQLLLDYATLKNAAGLKMFKPCFKHYLVRGKDPDDGKPTIYNGRIGIVHPDEWQYAMMLPSEFFVRGGRKIDGKKGTIGAQFDKTKVWSDSGKTYLKGKKP